MTLSAHPVVPVFCFRFRKNEKGPLRGGARGGASRRAPARPHAAATCAAPPAAASCGAPPTRTEPQAETSTGGHSRGNIRGACTSPPDGPAGRAVAVSPSPAAGSAVGRPTALPAAGEGDTATALDAPEQYRSRRSRIDTNTRSETKYKSNHEAPCPPQPPPPPPALKTPPATFPRGGTTGVPHHPKRIFCIVIGVVKYYLPRRGRLVRLRRRLGASGAPCSPSAAGMSCSAASAAPALVPRRAT